MVTIMKRMEKFVNKKLIFVIAGLVICFLVSYLFALIYKFDNENITNSNLSEYIINKDKYTYIIDDIQNTRDVINIYGFVAQLKKQTISVNRQFALIEGNNVILIPTIKIQRDGATEYFDDGNNYENMGIQGRILTEYLQKDKLYKIGIIVKDDGEPYIVVTDKFIENIEVEQYVL